MSASEQFFMELSSEEISQQHAIHEYAFGIISSDSKGLASVVSISEPYKKFVNSGSSPDEEEGLETCAGFQAWSMSRYQSLYQSSGFHEEDEDEEDDFKEDANNNRTSIPSAGHDLREQRRGSLRAVNSSGNLRATSNPKKIPGVSLRRRWSASSIFGGTSASPQNRVFPLDPDTPKSVSPSETWFSSLTQIPDKIRQHIADKNRFDVKRASREQLKQLHCY